jgi:hypothetical protein
MRQVAEGVTATREALGRESDQMREAMQRGFADTQGMMQTRLERLEGSTH